MDHHSMNNAGPGHVDTTAEQMEGPPAAVMVVFNRRISAQGLPYRMIQNAPHGSIGAGTGSYELQRVNGSAHELCCRIAATSAAEAVERAMSYIRWKVGMDGELWYTIKKN